MSGAWLSDDAIDEAARACEEADALRAQVADLKRRVRELRWRLREAPKVAEAFIHNSVPDEELPNESIHFRIGRYSNETVRRIAEALRELERKPLPKRSRR